MLKRLSNLSNSSDEHSRTGATTADVANSTNSHPQQLAPDGAVIENSIETSPILASDDGDADALEEEDFEALPAVASGFFDADTQAFMVSLLFHVVLILGLAIVPLVAIRESSAVALKAVPTAEVEEFTLIENVAVSEEMSTEVGANSSAADAMALSTAPVLAELSELPSPSFSEPVLNATFELNNQIEQAVGLVRSDVVVKGMTGVGTTGTDGAVDRITYEILRSMEERPTLVVWFFDQSGSLLKRRQEIRDRFDRIYEELGIIQDAQAATEDEPGSKDFDAPLLTSIYAFGEQVNLLTPKPTDKIDEIRDAIDSIQMDESGVERVFSALYKGVEKFKAYRSSRSGRGPERNVLFIAVTDERGDDANGLDVTIKECVKYAIPVYVVGVPAPFGRDVSYVKYVDPDPKFDQTPQWAEVDQGPESIMPERVKIGYRDDYYAEPVVDSGFGPFALSRLTYETGGIYFTVHPNRKIGRRVNRSDIDPFASNLQYFFDPETMSKYRPDYVSSDEYMKRVSESPLRQVLVRAAQLPRVDTLKDPQLNFIKRSEAGIVNELTQAQQQPARLEPPLQQLANLLATADEYRDREISPRWIAGYDLALGTCVAHKVRTEGYNLMLAKAKRGMNFEEEKSNTWVLAPSDEISTGSRLSKEADRATELLQGVAERHKGTPWGMLAERELRNPIGWTWKEEFTDLNPPPMANNRPNNNNTPPPPEDDKARMLKPPPPKRPLPKL